MTAPNILTDTTPMLLDDEPSVARSVITDAWGLYFAQGGVVMAAALRAMEAVLDRADLRLASASATFCRPVACGPVTTTVEVLRNGRRGAQVHGAVRDPSDAEGGTNVVVTAVFTDPSLNGPVLTPLPRPPEFTEAPPGDAPKLATSRDYPLGFLDNTEWQIATSTSASRAEDPAAIEQALPRLATWFRFTDPPAADGTAWDPALLAVPGDSLGSSLVVALGGGDTPVGNVSLQIGMEVFAPMVGTWIGVDSTCINIGNGLASGIVHLWSEAGDHVATLAQTGMLRSL